MWNKPYYCKQYISDAQHFLSTGNSCGLAEGLKLEYEQTKKSWDCMKEENVKRDQGNCKFFCPVENKKLSPDDGGKSLKAMLYSPGLQGESPSSTTCHLVIWDLTY